MRRLIAVLALSLVLAGGFSSLQPPSAYAGGCPDPGALGLAVALNNTSNVGEPCKWNASGATSLNLPDANWEATVSDTSGRIVIYWGPVSGIPVSGLTLRYLAAYTDQVSQPKQDRCTLLAQESTYGNSHGYTTYAGNFACVGFPTLVSQTALAPAATPAPTSISNPQDASNRIGGYAQYWTAPTWSGGDWVYNQSNGGLGSVPLRYPSFGRLHVWIWGKVITINSAESAKYWLVDHNFTFDQASFNNDASAP